MNNVTLRGHGKNFGAIATKILFVAIFFLQFHKVQKRLAHFYQRPS